MTARLSVLLLFCLSLCLPLCENVHIHEDAEVILVGGRIGGISGEITTTDVELAREALENECWRLYSIIFDASERKKEKTRGQRKVIVNKSKLVGTSSETVRDLQNILFNTKIVTGIERGITKIVFAHSKGAEVAYDALEDDALMKFLKTKQHIPSINRRNWIRKMRKHIAIFTLGGIQEIPRNFAKICYNVRFTNDKTATMGKIITKRHGKKIDMISLYEENFTVQENITPRRTLSTYIYSLSASSRSISSSAIGNHYLNDYIDSQAFRRMLIEYLDL